MESQLAVIRQRTHRPTMGKCRIHPWLGEDNPAALGTTKARNPEKRSLRIEASLNLHSNLSVHLFPQSERPVFPRVPVHVSLDAHFSI
jgi:hypothetical protein